MMASSSNHLRPLCLLVGPVRPYSARPPVHPPVRQVSSGSPPNGSQSLLPRLPEIGGRAATMGERERESSGSGASGTHNGLDDDSLAGESRRKKPFELAPCFIVLLPRLPGHPGPSAAHEIASSARWSTSVAEGKCRRRRLSLDSRAPCRTVLPKAAALSRRAWTLKRSSPTKKSPAPVQ